MTFSASRAVTVSPRRAWLPTIAFLVLLSWLPNVALAQSSRSLVIPPGTAPTSAVDPSTLINEPMTVANVVHVWKVVGVSERGSLLVDADGRAAEIALWPVALPPESTRAGKEARRYLASLVGRRLQFSFHEHRDHGALGLDRPPSSRAYTDAAAVLVERGLARYCPAKGVALTQLAELERAAGANGVGLWGEDRPFACPTG